MAETPKKIGKYDVTEKIGVGGFGTVYRGRDPFIKRDVAIKTCQSNDEEIKKRFFREAEFSGNLHHRNITTIYDFGVEDDTPYIVQEYLTGDDLDKIIKRGEPLPVPRKVEVLLAICDGLAYAHSAGIIHRDMKPSNIRLLADGNVKIMDFGIAKSFQSESTLTQTGITLGTAAYLAPEQIRGEPVSPATDVFSLGVLAYELFTGRKPFRGEHISTVLFKILNEAPEPVSRLAPEVPIELDDIVGRALEKDPAQRYTSVLEFRNRLAALPRGEAPEATLTSVTQIAPAPPALPPPESVTPPSGALARVPQPADPTPTPRSAAHSLPLEMVDFRSPRQVPAEAATSAIASLPPGKRRRAGLTAALIVIAAGGGGALFYYLTRQSGSGAPAPGPAASPGSARPATAGLPPAAPPQARTAPPVPLAKPLAPAPPPIARPATPSAPPPAKSAAAPAGAPAKAPEAKAPPRRIVRVTFTSQPSASLYVDGKAYGASVPARTLRLEEGQHRVRFELEDGTTYEEDVAAGPGGNDTVFHRFATGSLVVTAGPDWRGARVEVDGKLRGHLPLDAALMTSPGAHELAVVKDGLAPSIQTVRVEEGKRTEVHIAPPGGGS